MKYSFIFNPLALVVKLIGIWENFIIVCLTSRKACRKKLLEILLLPKSGYTGDNFKFLPTTEIPLHTYRMILINLDTYPERINASNFLKSFCAYGIGFIFKIDTLPYEGNFDNHD